MQDKYTAVWVSHTSISDFLVCPRAYFLKHVYKDPKTNHKIKLVSAPLSLGSAVHEVLESLSKIKTEERLKVPLLERYDAAWKKVSGKKGGFFDDTTEFRYKDRGADMIRRVINSPGPISRPAVKIQKDLPFFWLSDEDNIILCGKVDWLEYLPELDAVHIIDFKTGKYEEDDKSLQLPIYHLLVHHCQQRKVAKASYWYLESKDELTERTLPDLEEARGKILRIAQEIKLARQIQRMKCKTDGGCKACLPMEAVFERRAELVGVDEYNYDVYVLAPKGEEVESVIL